MKKIFLTKNLYSEIRKWEEMLGVSSTNNMRLLKLYIGMGVNYLFTREGKIMARDFNKLAKITHYRNPGKLIKEAVDSGSFLYEKCDKANMNNYGILWIASPLFASENLLKNVSAVTHESDSKNNSESGHNISVIYNNTTNSHSPARGNGFAEGKEGTAAPATESAVSHPHGMHEYCITGSPQRLYDIDNMSTPIPDDAPDRPTATAVWSRMARTWNEPNEKRRTGR